MKLPVIYVFTHDSIGLGEDGTTHQPVEQLASFRAMPGNWLIRPADANEASYAWRMAMERKDGPTLLVLTRQKLPVFDRKVLAPASDTRKGAYVLSPEKGDRLDILLLATGSEVQLILEAQKKLEENDIYARVISMPCWEAFRKEAPAYQREVIPPSCLNRLAVEAGSPQGWREWVGNEGAVIGMTDFGASAPAKELFKQYGFTAELIVETAKQVIHTL